MGAIIRRSAKLLAIPIEEGAIKNIARSSRFTPRLANRLLKRSRDFAEVNNLPIIDEDSVLKTLDLMEIDSMGLDAFDRKLLEIIISKFRNRAVGINALAAALGEERRVIEEIHEPYLLKMGLLQRTSAGRMATEMAMEHLRKNF